MQISICFSAFIDSNVQVQSFSIEAVSAVVSPGRIVFVSEVIVCLLFLVLQ